MIIFEKKNYMWLNILIPLNWINMFYLFFVDVKHVVSQVDESVYSLARCKLENLLNKSMRIRMTDGRTLVGLFLCTDRDCNVILGSAQEFLKSTGTQCTPGTHLMPEVERVLKYSKVKVLLLQ